MERVLINKRDRAYYLNCDGMLSRDIDITRYGRWLAVMELDAFQRITSLTKENDAHRYDSHLRYLDSQRNRIAGLKCSKGE